MRGIHHLPALLFRVTRRIYSCRHDPFFLFACVAPVVVIIDIRAEKKRKEEEKKRKEEEKEAARWSKVERACENVERTCELLQQWQISHAQDRGKEGVERVEEE